MGSTSAIQQSWTITPAAPALPVSSVKAGGLFRTLLGLAFAISFFVMVEPAPVDGMMIGLFACGVMFGMVQLRTLPVLPVALLSGLALANLASMVGADNSARATFYAFVTFYMMISWALIVGAVNHYGESVLKPVFLGYAFAVMVTVIPAAASYFHVIGFQYVLLKFGRPKGFFKDPNVYGPYLVFIAVLAITGCLPVKSRLVQIFVAIVAAVGVIFSYSRAAWINYALALAVFAVFDHLLPCRAADGRSSSLPMLVTVGVLAVTSLGALSQVPAVKTMLAARLGEGGMHDYDKIRFQTQRMAVAAAIEHPLGIGPGQSEATYTYATHSAYMRILGENGLFGLFCFVSFLFATMVQAIVQISKAQSRYWRSIYLVAAACICGHLINSGVVDTVHWRHAWFLLALPWVSNTVVAAQRANGRTL